MFELLWSFRKSILICGGFGASKTVSIILFCHLTAIIHKFIFEASDKSTAVEQKEEAAQLKILDPSLIPRVWYWTINWNQIIK
jgi:hypothetical protein